MTNRVLASDSANHFFANRASDRTGVSGLRAAAVTAGVCWSIAFVGIGLFYGLQMYGDGSIFSYAVAVQDAWAIHLHNISGRIFVYLFSFVPAEAYVALSKDPVGGVAVYGLLFFAAQLLGLSATYAVDRSRNRIIFGFACFSTACLAPLVFGFPTEMWLAHALFWPALALCHYASGGLVGIVSVFLVLLALVLTHEGALVFAFAILATLLLRGYRDAAFLRAAGVLAVVIPVWFAIKMVFRPDNYIADVLDAAEHNFFNIHIFISGLFALLAIALIGYGIFFIILRRMGFENAHAYSGVIVAVVLAAYWLLFDQSIHTENRYYLRTVVFIATPVLGVLAAMYALGADGSLKLATPILSRMMKSFSTPAVARFVLGALLVVTVVNAVETAKFVAAWVSYKAAIRELATSTTSDPELGDPRFVSSHRIGGALNRLSWSSTTPFLSVLMAPRFAPSRLVVDPAAGYFWLPCQLATANERAVRAIPVESRRLIRVHACMHR
jgi:hypothetical protein